MKRRFVTVKGFVPSSATVNANPRGAPPPAPPGHFRFGESGQSHFAPEGFARVRGSLAFSVGLRRCAYGISLSRMRTHRIPSVPRWAQLRPVLDAREPTGRKNKGAKVLCSWAPYGAPAHRKPLPASLKGRGQGPRASLASTRTCCRVTVRQRREAQGEVVPSGMPFLSPISLGTQRNRPVARGQNPVHIVRGFF